jgi:hypothetical protein
MMQTTHSDNQRVIGILAIGLVMIVLAIVAIVIAYSYQSKETIEINRYEPASPPAESVNTPLPPPVIEVEKPVIQPVPVPVTETIIKEVPVDKRDRNQQNRTAPAPSNADSSEQTSPAGAVP